MTIAEAPPILLEDTPISGAAGGLYRRQNALTGLIAGIVLGFVGWVVSHQVLQGSNWGSDMVVTVTMVGWVIGFNIGVGTFNAPIRWMLGHDQSYEDELYAAGVTQGKRRYWKFCTDHKVVGTQYLVLVIALFAVGGTLAMMMRTQLITPHSTFLSPNSYNAIVSIHGMVMIIATIIMVTGPFTNFIMPIMIGAKDMAFPRLNAMSFWVVVSAVPPLLATFFLGGVDAGWTTYAPLSVQAPAAMDAFSMTMIVFVVSVTVAGINTIVTLFTMRAKGMTLGRLPIFTWASLVGAALSIYAMPALLIAFTSMISDRVTGTSFFVAAQGGTGWLWENAFWIFGHPEVYIILIPPVGAMLEVASTFARKPLFGYKVTIAAFTAVAALSLMVWAHHMFTTGWAPDLAGPFMVTTELISIPTGIIFLCIVGTIWKGSIWTRLPMYFVYLFLWDFIIGGVTGIYLSDVPADNFFHGDMFVTAHFHYTLLGGAMIAAIAGLCYWFPKISGKMLNERIGKTAFWIIAIAFQVTYFGQFWEGFQGMPRRVAYYDPIFLRANQMTSVGGYGLMIGFLVLLYCLIHSWRHGKPASANPWQAKSLEWKVPTPVPLVNFLVDPVVVSDPYGFGEPEPDGAGVELPDPDRELVPTLSSDRPVTGGEVL
ncbi:MAG TPA: cbb3-type cytochrome c oxidase subunit I [Acidimicrobiales bacterium]|nr:cbb3-type cytochrome c oxidase subunit I [Acidimicrobiales bacterium]